MARLFLLICFGIVSSACIPQIAIERWEGASYICNQWDTSTHHGDCYAPTIGPPPPSSRGARQ